LVQLCPANPFTGVVIFLSEPGETPTWYAYGGTSLATPMFSGLWAMANQEAGEPLGQALLIYSPCRRARSSMSCQSVPPPTASIKQSATVTDSYNADQVTGSQAAPSIAVREDYFYVQDLPYAVSFGTESSLSTGTGWDDVTGVGTPNGQAVANYFAPAPSTVK
jgi:subtilase family serine protease